MFSEISFTAKELKEIDCENLIQGLPEHTCHQYNIAFSSAAKTAQERGDEKTSQVLMLLAGMTSMMLRPAEKNETFTPLAVFADGRRTAALSDFSDEQLDILKEWLPDCKDAELKARIADVIWTMKRKGNFQTAEVAVDAYLISGERLLESEFPHQGVERIIRAVHLAASLGKNSKWFPKVIAQIELSIEKYAGEATNFIVSLMELLIEYRQGNPAKYIPIAKSLALKHEGEKAWLLARRTWETMAKWSRMAKDQTQEFVALERIAATYIAEADENTEAGRGYMVAAHHIQSAIEVLRAVPGTKDRQAELHIILLTYQEKSLNELGHLSGGEIDLTRPVEIAIEQIKGKSFIEALFALAVLANPIKRKELEGYANAIAKESLLYSILATTHLDSRGRVIGKKPSLLIGSAEEIAQAREAEMHQWAQIQQQATGMVIHAARLHLLTEHNPKLEDVLEIVAHNPFVPSGRELLFAQGLLAGLQGDYLFALHLLTPQLENSIRIILNGVGVTTSGISPEGIQEDFDLNKLLDMNELINIFGEDLVFDLKGTLVSRFGSNFRNLLAHGLLEHGHFLSSQAAYIWCMILRLCCVPIIIRRQESKDAPPKE